MSWRWLPRPPAPRALLLLPLSVALVLAVWPPQQGLAQQPPRGPAVPERVAPVLAWYYPEFSQGWAEDVANAQRAGLDALIVSQTTQPVGASLFSSPIARAAEGTDLALTLGIETNIRYDSQEALVAELQRIVREEVNHPRFLRFGGKPVIVFWRIPAIVTAAGQTPQQAWASVRAQVDPGRATLWIAEGGDPAPATGTLSYLPSFDALHLYSVAWDAEPSRALSSWAQRTRGAPGNKLWVATVMPGGDYAEGPPPWKYRERENGAYLEKAWRGALATNPSMVIVTSLNETHERSNIDPRPEWGTLYVDLNKRFADQYRAQRGGQLPTPPTPTLPAAVISRPPTAVPGGPTPVPVTVAQPAPGTSLTVASVQPNTPTSLSLSLPSGQQANVAIGAGVTGALQASQPAVTSALVEFNLAPPAQVAAVEAVIGGGQVALVDQPLDIRLELRDAGNNAVAPVAEVAQTAVEITLPLLQPADPNSEFHWLFEVLENGVPVGYTWSPHEVADPIAGTVTIPLRLDELQGTLFVPASITPGYVQNHDPLVHMWSGPTREARDFGFAGPQWTTFPVVAPQVGLRLLVYSPVVGNYAWIDVSGVGPSGPG
ncbi:MAG TPA: hypothetical protein VH257_10895 [Chloroflexota bacterium]|nr:hypothetical protein [Chloroflexota bacterium]